MVTLIEVIDTAVKVGLGALISGTTTYYVTKQKYSHEIHKEYISKQRDLLHESLSMLDQSISKMNHAERTIYYKKDQTEEGQMDISKEKVELVEAINLARKARVYMYLAGDSDLIELFDQYLVSIKEEFIHIESNGVNFDIDFVNQKSDEQENIKNNIFGNIGGTYKNIHA